MGRTQTEHRFQRAREWLPRGRTITDDVWRVRHRTLSYVLWLHVVGVFGFALVMGEHVDHALLETSLVAVFALAAAGKRRSREAASAMTALGLVVSSAVLVHLSGGMIEMHFHFFVMVCLLSLYQDWLPFLLSIGFVVVHHTVMGTIAPTAVYNHPTAIANPLRWALVHGLFVLGLSASSVVAWRINEDQALKDTLTALPNRRLLRDRLEHALTRAARTRTTLALVFIDLDHFKQVNDTYGHSAGDELLQGVAARIRGAVRSADTAARVGGDEFVVLLEHVDTEGVELVAARLVESIGTPITVRDQMVGVGASIGIALSRPGVSADDLYREADAAMYRAKSAGGRTYMIADVRP